MKKLVSIVLAATLCMAMATTGVAAAAKITGIHGNITDKDYTDITVNPGKVYEFPLTTDMFEWGDGDVNQNGAVTESQLSSAKVTLKTTYSKNKSKDIIEEITISSKKFSVTNNKSTAYIKVKFIEDYDKTDEFEFDFTVYLAYKGNKVSDSEIQFQGEFKHNTFVVDEDEDYVDMSDGLVAEPEAYIRSIDCYLGQGLFIRTKMFSDKLYYGKVEVGVTSADEKIVDAYPEIDTIYTLKTINMSSGTVYFETDDLYYVYNSDGKYIGTTEDELKYSNKYYLASEKINLGGGSGSSGSSGKDDVVYEDDDDDEEVPVAVEDDYDDVPVIHGNGNTNDNPSTGAGRILGSVMILGLLAVSVMGLTGRASGRK